MSYNPAEKFVQPSLTIVRRSHSGHSFTEEQVAEIQSRLAAGEAPEDIAVDIAAQQVAADIETEEGAKS